MTLAKALRARPILIAALTLLTLCGSASLYEMDWAAAGCCGLTWPQPDPIQTERTLAAKDPKAQDAAVQRRGALDLLAGRPYNANAWLRLAYADGLRHGRFTEDGRHAIEMSYLTLPYAGMDAPFRIGLLLENWAEVSPQGRKDCVQEMAIAKTDPKVVDALRRRVRDIRNPGGRLAALVMGL